MKKSKISVTILLSLAIILIVGGCRTRSISSISGHSGRDGYRGELNELSVLGVRTDDNVTDTDISDVLASREGKPVALKRGDVLAVIQSGARFPDKEMSDSLETLSKVVPLSGVPPKEQHLHGREQKNKTPIRIDRSLRMAAAKGGANKLLVYWGILESAAEPEQAAKQLSWVPLLGRVIPDETQHVQMRVKAALIDVATGNWTMIRTEPMQDKRMSSRLTRDSSDLKQIMRLKEKAYAQFAGDLKTRFLL